MQKCREELEKQKLEPDQIKFAFGESESSHVPSGQTKFMQRFLQREGLNLSDEEINKKTVEAYFKAFISEMS